MCAGPIVAGIGMLLLLRVDADGAYLSDVLPAILVFGLGLSATVAPLTATVLDSVDERHVGIASGINNGVSRVAGLLAIAVLGAVISGVFGSVLDDNLGTASLNSAAIRAVDDAKRQPLGSPDTGDLSGPQASRVEAAASDASTEAFHLGVGIGAVLMIIGGIVAGVGIVNPKRREEHVVARAAPAGECGRSAEYPACPSPVPGELGEPVGATASGSLDPAL
jgi:hypothetical protein